MQKMKLENYQAPNFELVSVDLTFELDELETLVKSKMTFRNLVGSQIEFDGVDLHLNDFLVNGEKWRDIEVTENVLVARNLPADPVIEISNTINPKENSSLMGLYQSNGRYFTQNEPQGFRQITYFPDRPDVMSDYTTTIIGDGTKLPVMLSNGDLIEESTLPDGRVKKVWRDPHKKPCYLFALVAGDLAELSGEFVTRSGRKVALRFFSEAHRIGQCEFALESLKRAMKWDEERFGLEYDLDTYMVVVVDDFNGGAMENKGLNVFNTRCVLADPHITTDEEYQTVESVVGHEYFHNWTGNRVTLRDWFHLSLKEGLTVFRDQEFSSDLHSRGVVRVENVQELWIKQFTEDSGPNAHPVRPLEAYSVNNFFSPTIYEKGAEVIRMIFTLLGREKFRVGMEHYIQSYDGQAVTIEEFVSSFEKTAGIDLTQFRRWYSTPGTPEVSVEKADGEIRLSQKCSTFAGAAKEPLHIPISYNCFDSNGKSLQEGVFDLKEWSQNFSVPAESTVSLLRDYSAPVILRQYLTPEERALLITSEQDMFQVWYQCQTLLLESAINGDSGVFQKALQRLLKERNHDSAFLGMILELPAETMIAKKIGAFSPSQVSELQMAMSQSFGSVCLEFRDEAMEQVQRLASEGYNEKIAGDRSLHLKILRYCIATGDQKSIAFAREQLSSDNATLLTSLGQSLLFYCKDIWTEVAADLRQSMSKDDFLMNKYYGMISTAPFPGVLERIEAEMSLKPFQLRNPNNVLTLIGSFASFNIPEFHHESGRGYRFLADQILKLDAINPQSAARLCRGFERLVDLPEELSSKMRTEMKRVSEQPDLSANVKDLCRV